MKLKINRVETWVAAVDDRAGGVADKLEPLARAGVNLEFAFGRRTPEQPGKGVLFVYPVKGAKALRAAREAGFAKPTDIVFVRIEGADQPGASSRMTRALANAAISFRAFSASAIGKKFVAFLAVDSADDAAKAASALKKA